MDDDGIEGSGVFRAFRLPALRLQHQRTRTAHVLVQQSGRRVPECDGLGVKQFFDADLVVADRRSLLAEGAIRGWDRRNVYYFHMLTSLAKHYEFDVEAPFGTLKKRQRDAILNGSGQERIDFSYVNDRGDVIQRRHRFEGVVPNMERRYRETDSTMVRENLARYLTVRECPACGGTRLKRGIATRVHRRNDVAAVDRSLRGRRVRLFRAA